MPLITVACLIAAASGSIKIANSEGERGHPCLVPLLRQKLEDVWAFVLTHAVGELYNIFNQFMKEFPKPNLCKVANRKFQLTYQKLFLHLETYCNLKVSIA